MNNGEYIGAGSGTTKLLLHLNGNSTDSSGNGNNGTDTAVTYSLANGKLGQGAGFNGSTSRIQLPLPSVAGFPTGASARTFAFWFKTATLPGANLQNMVGYGANSTGQLFYASIFNNKFYLWGFGTDISGTTTLSINTWYFGCITYDGTTAKVYLNGLLENSAALTLNTGNTISYIGAAIGTSYPGYHNGTIDEVIIENRVGTAEEIKRYYTYTKGYYAIL